MDKMFTFQFTEQQVAQIFNALAERPFKEVFQLVNNMNDQLQVQTKVDLPKAQE
jgi:hypothetical protein